MLQLDTYFRTVNLNLSIHVCVFMVTCINHFPLRRLVSSYSLFVIMNLGSCLNGTVSSVLLWCQLQTRDTDKRLHIFEWKKYGLYLWIIGNKMPCTIRMWFIRGKWRLRRTRVYVERWHIEKRYFTCVRPNTY